VNPFLDDYVAKVEPDFAWREVEELRFKTLWGGSGYILNVTSLNWMNVSEVYSPTGSLWTHQVQVIVPHKLSSTNVAYSWITGGCNSYPDQPANTLMDIDTLIPDEVSHNTGAIAISIKQIPNCPLFFESDPHSVPR